VVGHPQASARMNGRGLARRVRPAVGRASLVCGTMEGIVLRVRLISGDSMDVTYEERDASSADELIDHVVSTLAEDSGVLRCRHGDRLVVLYARGVAAVEVAPRGAVL
jgi:hypothetical protein